MKSRSVIWCRCTFGVGGKDGRMYADIEVQFGPLIDLNTEDLSRKMPRREECSSIKTWTGRTQQSRREDRQDDNDDRQDVLQAERILKKNLYEQRFEMLSARGRFGSKKKTSQEDTASDVINQQFIVTVNLVPIGFSDKKLTLWLLTVLNEMGIERDERTARWARFRTWFQTNRRRRADSNRRAKVENSLFV